MNNIDRVNEFHDKFDIYIAKEFSMKISKDLFLLRRKLLVEELEEFITATVENDRQEQFDAILDIQYILDGTSLTFGANSAQDEVKDVFRENSYMDWNSNFEVFSFYQEFYSSINQLTNNFLNKNEQGIRLNLTKMQWLINKITIALDFMDIFNEGLEEVHASNMSKLGEDGKPVRREDGKVLKGPKYFKPNLEAILYRKDSRKEENVAQ